MKTSRTGFRGGFVEAFVSKHRPAVISANRIGMVFRICLVRFGMVKSTLGCLGGVLAYQNPPFEVTLMFACSSPIPNAPKVKL